MHLFLLSASKLLSALKQTNSLACAGTETRLSMDCKASVGQLKAPEQAQASHGPDLAIDDFLSRAVAWILQDYILIPTNPHTPQLPLMTQWPCIPLPLTSVWQIFPVGLVQVCAKLHLLSLRRKIRQVLRLQMPDPWTLSSHWRGFIWQSCMC